MNKNQYIDYYQHQIVPPKRINNNYSNNIKTILIRSADRDITRFPNKYDFILDLEASFTDIVSLEIIKAYFNYNVPVINSSNDSFSVYINLEDQTEDNKDDAFIEIDNIKLGNMFTYDTDKIIELFNRCIDNYLVPKIKSYLTKLAYTDTTNNGIVTMSLPKIILDYDEKTDRFYVYKTNASFDINTNYLECYESYNDASALTFSVNENSFGLFGIDTRVQKQVNDATIYNSDPNITWEDRWEEGQPRTIYEPNPKNSILKMLGFSTKYAFDCNKFLLNTLDVEIIHTEYLGTSMQYEGFKFISKTGDEFLLKYNSGNPRLFLVDTKPSDNNIDKTSSTGYILPVIWDATGSKFIENYTTPTGGIAGKFDVITIADKIYFSSVWEFANELNNIFATAAPGIPTSLPTRSILTYDYIKQQLPIEIKLSQINPVSGGPYTPPYNNTLQSLINFNNTHTTPWNFNEHVHFESWGVICLNTINPYINVGNSDYKQWQFNSAIQQIFVDHGFVDTSTWNLPINYNHPGQTDVNTNLTNSVYRIYLPYLPEINPTVTSYLFKDEYNLNGNLIKPYDATTNPEPFLFPAPFPYNPLPATANVIKIEVLTNYQIHREANNIPTTLPPEDYTFSNKTSLVNQFSLLDPEVYQVGKFSISKTNNEFLYNQIKNALCTNSDNLLLNFSFTNTSGEIMNYTLQLSDSVKTETRTITINLSDLFNLDESNLALNTSGHFINIGAIHVNMTNDASKASVITSNPNPPPNFINNNAGYHASNINCPNNETFSFTKRVGLLNYNISNDSISIEFGYYLNTLLVKQNKYGEINLNTNSVFLLGTGVDYGTGSNSDSTNNTINRYDNIDNNKIIISHYDIYNLCQTGIFNFESYKEYLLPKSTISTNSCKPFTRYSQLKYNNYVIIFRPGSSFNYMFNTHTIIGSPPTLTPPWGFDSFYEHLQNSQVDFNGNTPVPTNLIYYDSETNGARVYSSNCMDEFINNSTGISSYKYQGQYIDKISSPFTNDNLIVKSSTTPASTGEYESVIISTNFFIADQTNCIYPSDYLILDIEELNNKYSNNNNIEKHAFVEIPNNTGALIYYESTNLGYSTKEFNPPIRKLNRLTIKIRDQDGNILPNEDTSKDYTLIMNVQEINNSSSTSIVNN